MSDETAEKINLPQKIRLVSIFMVCAVYVLLFCAVKPGDTSSKAPVQKEYDAKIMKLVNITEYVPPVSRQVPAAKSLPPETQTQTVVNNVASSEKIIETKDNVEEIVYLPQSKISKVPVLPARKILSRIEYPAAAKKQGIEGVVFLELCIDEKGSIRDIKVLKDPGNGFAEAAVKALSGITVIPALVNGEPCAVRYRYPIRFSLK